MEFIDYEVVGRVALETEMAMVARQPLPSQFRLL
jgi:hypothetical protein